MVAFNSAFNRDIFLSSINTHINKSPDFKARGLADEIKPKTAVLYFPVFTSLLHAFPTPPPPPPPTTTTQQAMSQHLPHAPEHMPETRSGTRAAVSMEQPLNIVWPHRWEFDKNPEDFFAVLFNLADDGVPFTVSIMVRLCLVILLGLSSVLMFLSLG